MTMMFNRKKCARALASVQRSLVRELLVLKGMEG